MVYDKGMSTKLILLYVGSCDEEYMGTGKLPFIRYTQYVSTLLIGYHQCSVAYYNLEG